MPEMRKQTLILVDLDGTLFDTVAVNAASYRAALEEVGATVTDEYYAKYCNGGYYKTFLRPLLGGDPVGEQAAVLLLPGEAHPGQLRQGAHLPPQLPAHAGQIQGGLPQGRILLGQLQVLQVAHHAHHAVQALVQDGQIGVVLRAPLFLHHRGEQLHRRRQVVHLLPELLRQERPQILRLKCQTAPLLPVIHSLCRPALNSYGKASITKFGSSLKRKCRNLSKPPRLPILPL